MSQRKNISSSKVCLGLHNESKDRKLRFSISEVIRDKSRREIVSCQGYGKYLQSLLGNTAGSTHQSHWQECITKETGPGVSLETVRQLKCGLQSLDIRFLWSCMSHAMKGSSENLRIFMHALRLEIFEHLHSVQVFWTCILADRPTLGCMEWGWA